MSHEFYELVYDDSDVEMWDLYCFHNLAMEGIKRIEKLKPRYQTMRCPKCRQMDLLPALRAGLDAIPLVDDLQVDLAATADGPDIMSYRALEILRRIPSFDVEAFPIPGNSEYAAIYPVRMIEAPSDTLVVPSPVIPWGPKELFRHFQHPCKKCGRARGTSIRHCLTDIRVQLEELLGDVVVTGLRYRNDGGHDKFAMFVNEQVRDTAKREQFSGMRFLPLFSE